MPPSTGAAGTSTLATAAQAQATFTVFFTFLLDVYKRQLLTGNYRKPIIDGTVSQGEGTAS